jgi:hypothetical protein
MRLVKILNYWPSDIRLRRRRLARNNLLHLRLRRRQLQLTLPQAVLLDKVAI